jgi:hypothetical protein
MRKWSRWPVLACASLLLAACDFEAPPPKLTAPPEPPAPPLSTLTVSLSVPAADVARLLNDKTAGHLASIRDQSVKCGIGKCKLTLDAVRTGQITAAARGSGIQIAMPFAVTSQLELPGFLAAVKTDANLAGQVDARASLTLDKDWRIKPVTSGTVRFQNGHLRIGPIKTDFANIWNDNAELLSRPLFRMFDDQMAAGLHVAQQASKLWTGAFNPIPIGNSPRLWLALQPEHIRVGEPAAAGGNLIFTLGLDVRARVIASDEAPRAAPVALPRPEPLAGPANRFDVAVPVLLPYREAAGMALAALKKNPPRAGSHTIRIEKLAILPSGQDVVVATSFCIEQNWDPTDMLSGCGSGYLRGTPQYDVQARVIRIVNLHFDVATEDIILGTMHSLAGPDLGKSMEKGLKFDVGKEIDRMQQQVAAALASPQGRDIVLSGAVDSFGTPSLTWTKDGFLALFSAKGTVRAGLHI